MKINHFSRAIAVVLCFVLLTLTVGAAQPACAQGLCSYANPPPACGSRPANNCTGLTKPSEMAMCMSTYNSSLAKWYTCVPRECEILLPTQMAETLMAQTGVPQLPTEATSLPALTTAEVTKAVTPIVPSATPTQAAKGLPVGEVLVVNVTG